MGPGLEDKAQDADVHPELQTAGSQELAEADAGGRDRWDAEVKEAQAVGLFGCKPQPEGRGHGELVKFKLTHPT